MKEHEDGLTRLFDSFVKFVTSVIRILKEGSRQVRFDFTSLIMMGLLSFMVYLETRKLTHLGFIYWLFPSRFTGRILLNLYENHSFWSHLGFNLSLLGSSILFVLGLKPYFDWMKFQRAIDQLNFKNGMDFPPKLKRVRQIDSFRRELTIFCPGIGIERFEEKRGSLQTSFGQKIESFVENYQQKGVKIILTTKYLPLTVPFKKICDALNADGDFLIGESDQGVRVQSIKDLPHVLIAGSTGGGKSVFLKQMLLGLLRSTPKLQMYLIDLKGGLELIDFKPLSNVRIVKTEKDAVQLLRKVHQEMKRRFDFLEQNRLKVVVPGRDKLDRIVVAIDESSVLYTKSGSDEIQSKLVAEARFLTDEIAKLSRAAAIHLILATQKVSKETVDTKVQENMAGKICFKVNTLQGSVAILGNKAAFELPQIPGRAIWSLGNQEMEVQAPMISEKELDEEILCLQKAKANPTYQPMLELPGMNKGDKMQFSDLIKDGRDD